MSGASELFIQPCTLIAGGQLVAGFPDGSVTATNLPSPNNLISASPPTLLEAYEVYAVSIAWGVQFADNTADGVSISAQLRMTLNDRLQWSTVDPEVVVNNIIEGSWTADLVNPIRVGARDRLGLLMVLTGVPVTPTGSAMIAAQPSGSGSPSARSTWLPVESTISYAVIDLPGSRRL